MIAVIGGERISQTLNIDMYSQYYGPADGYSYCSDNFNVEITDQIPEWMSVINSNAVTVGTTSPLHDEDSFDLAITIQRED